ncbi:thioesterase family protein [Stutzerimonas nitrititolerans]|uniref:thioesterase family protein n=1 Tax=Stutzerimonas nitrititolerans TaxID=2482751 RepID=UPI0028B07362|nr:thioesterase family protein [Stutzerimonas nitrititolerans]
MSNLHSAPLSVGLTHSETLVVAERHTVPQVEPNWSGFADMPPVLATAMMIGFIEQTCIEGLRPFLSTAQRTVGIHVDVSHVAATPIGLKVTANVELTAIEGKTLVFKVACRDESGLIGEGTHRRAIIDLQRFIQRLEEKAGRAGN